MEGIQVSVEKVGANQDIAVVKVGGYIDTTTSAELEHSLSSVIKSDCYNVIIDLGNVDYISSAGWGIFISEIKGIREKGGDLKLVKMIPDVYEVFELLEFHYILKAFSSLDEAVQDFARGTGAQLSVPPAVGNDNQKQEDVQVVSKTETKVLQTDPGATRPPKSTFDTIEDKIRQIVFETPEYGSIQIMKALNTPRFGNIKLGWFEVRRHLKRLNLDSKKKRSAYFKLKTMG
ncbi:MAG: STAS domain-containing protein [bacterium]